MALVFSWRSNTTAAFFAPGGEESYRYNAGSSTLASIQVNSLTGNIGGFALDMNNSGVSSWVGFNGIGNTPKTNPITINYRFAKAVSGTATATDSLLQLGGETASYFSVYAIQHQAGTGNLVFTQRNEVGQTSITNGIISSGFDFGDTSNHDLTIAWGGTASVDIFFYVDGVTIGSLNPTRHINYANIDNPFETITIGRYLNNNVSSHFGNELLIFDHELTPASIASVFTGPTRASFYSTTVSQPVNSTDPGAANVNSGTTYTFKGLSLTGTLALGTFTDPGVANVNSGTSYIFNSSTLTGTLHDATFTDPGIANVLLNTDYIFNDSTRVS